MLIALITTMFIVLFLGIKTFKLTTQNKQLVQLINALNIKIDSNSDPVKEDFLKFVSDSREWAFEYIEEFQKELNVFIKEVEPLINYFDKYGSVGPESPDKEALNKISLAYKELIKLLPEEK
jgi:hypothetical protein